MWCWKETVNQALQNLHGMKESNSGNLRSSQEGKMLDGRTMETLKESLQGRWDDSGLGMKMRSKGDQLEVNRLPPEYSQHSKIEGNSST